MSAFARACVKAQRDVEPTRYNVITVPRRERFMKRYVEAENRSQGYLAPENLDDHIAEHNFHTASTEAL